MLDTYEAVILAAVFAVCVLQFKKGNAVTGVLVHVAVPAILIAGAAYGHA